MADTPRRRALHNEAEINRQLMVLSHELERWRVDGERALEELDHLSDGADEDELAMAQEQYEHCVAKLNEIASQIERLQHPEADN